MTIPYLPWNQPDDRAGQPAVRDDEVELTYAEVADRVETMAGLLRQHGIGPGDVVAVMLPNRAELVLTILAAWRLGATATPINPAFTATEADYQLRDSGARLIVNLGADAPDGGLPSIAVDELAAQLGLRAADGDAATSTSPEAADPPAAVLPPVRSDAVAIDDIALLIYTSGSTGRPKGVMLSHANLVAMTEQMARQLQLSDADHCLLILPLFHVNALLVSVLTPLAVGAQVTIMGRFAPEPFLARLEQVRPTYFSGVPAIFALLAALPAEVIPDTSSLRYAICGAAPVSAELLAHSEQRFGFVMVEGYGLTEATCASAVNPVDGVRKLGTVGPAIEGQRIAIMSPDDELLPPGAPGEVVISGPTVMQGYLNRPEETAATIRDGWLHTGDVGVLDEDGYLTIVDRIKDMIIRGGENLYPKEIEATLAEVEGVLEAAVVGRPDEVMGEVPVAYVVCYPEASITEEDLREHCRQHLTRVKVPVSITIVDELPRNPVGKIDKPTLRGMLA